MPGNINKMQPQVSASDGGELDPAAFLRVVGKRIRILRLTRELTQDELAAAAGISRSFVVEHGAKGIDVVRLLRLARALDVPLDELVKQP